MKPIQTLLVLAGFSLATSIPAAQQSSGSTEKAEPQTQAATNHVGASQAPASASTADAIGKSVVTANGRSTPDGGTSILGGRQAPTATSLLAQPSESASN